MPMSKEATRLKKEELLKSFISAAIQNLRLAIEQQDWNRVKVVIKDLQIVQSNFN